MRNLVRLMIRAYQYAVSPLLGNHCRFYPSCSQYAQEAIDRFGLVRGGGMALLRLSRCHPRHPGGFDPVPKALVSEPPFPEPTVPEQRNPRHDG